MTENVFINNLILTDGCNKECDKQYGHEGNCMCDVNRENHTCKIECQLYALCGKKCSGNVDIFLVMKTMKIMI